MPESLLAEELGRAGMQGTDEEGPGGGRDEAVEASARHRLRQGLVLAQLVSDLEIAPDPGAVRAEIERMAMTYEDPSRVVGWFYSDPSRLRPVESRLMEQRAVDATLARATVIDEPCEFDELMNPGQTSEASSCSRVPGIPTQEAFHFRRVRRRADPSTAQSIPVPHPAGGDRRAPGMEGSGSRNGRRDGRQPV